MPKNKIKPSIESICVQDEFPNTGVPSHIQPPFMTSTFIYPSAEAAIQVFKGEESGLIYSRWSHPNAELLERKIEKLECFDLKTEAKALVFTTGMSAINTLFQSLLRPGDVLICQGNVYGTTIDHFNYFAKSIKAEIIYTDFKKLNELESLLKKHKGRVKLMYAETPSNPTINCYDLKSLSQLAKRYGTKFAVDNTFATPLLQQPFAFGADFIIHSATKFMNGHGTGLGGFLLSADVSFMNEEVWKVRKLQGTICPPLDSWLLNNGIKTLPVRMKQHCDNAQQIAEFLEQHNKVSAVNYLGLTKHADYVLAKKQMKGYGGVLSFELKSGSKGVKRLLNRVRLCKLSASLGTCDTLIQQPATMTHCFVPKEQREAFGITEGLVRLSVGLENVHDIIEDLDVAL